jgi:hypothetical protein
MRWGLAALLLAAGAIGLVPLASAHHAFTRTYFEGTWISIEGDVDAFDYRNPHSFLYVIVSDANQQPQRWAAEWAPAALLRRMQVPPDRLQPGDHVIVSGFAGRDPAEHRILLRAIERPKDKWKWSFEK